MQDEIDVNLKIWGREMSIKIIFGVLDGQAITELQKTTYEQFMNNYEDILNQAFNKFKEYIYLNFPNESKQDDFNIFYYLKPKYVFIKNSITANRICGFSCDFRFDMENELVAYIENEEVTKIGTQDIIL